MPVKVGALHRKTKLGPVELPGLDPDEWITVRETRNAIDDMKASIASSERRPINDAPEMEDGAALDSAEDDPDVAEAENRGNVPSEFIQNQANRWLEIWKYMYLDMNMYDELSPEDQAAGKTRGRKLDPKSEQDVEDVFSLLASELITILDSKGGATPSSHILGKDGKPIPFPGTDEVGTQGKQPSDANPSSGVLGEGGADSETPGVELLGAEEHAS